MSADLRTPIKRAVNLGSAKHGVHHFVVQRLTALALIVLALWFVVLVMRFLHADYATARTALAEPLNATLMIAFVVALFWHSQLGLQVIVEDYVHTTWLEVTLQIAIKFACLLGALVCVLAVVRVALGNGG